MKRYVVGEVDGRSDILIAEDAKAVLEIAPKVFARDLWLNRSTPADLAQIEDPVVADKMIHEPPSGGAIFRFVHFFPGSEAATVDEILETHALLDSAHKPEKDDLAKAKDPSMHRTNSLNYLTLASGKLWMLTEGKDVLLEPGDLIIQNGGIHGWRVHGDEPALLIAVLVDGARAD